MNRSLGHQVKGGPNDALRATILEGAPLAAQAGRLAVLVAWTAVSLLLALSWFRWT